MIPANTNIVDTKTVVYFSGQDEILIAFGLTQKELFSGCQVNYEI